MKKTGWRRLVSALLAALLVVGHFPTAVLAEDTAGLCAHHETHTGCGYREAAEGSPCAHVHDESCGYNEEAGTPCAHSHEEGCGYAEAVEAAPCGYICELCAAEPEEPTEPEVTTEPTEPSEPEETTEPSEPTEPEMIAVEAWTWVGGEELTGGELALPGASAANVAYFEDIVSLLPYGVSTAQGELTVSWSCPGYPTEGAFEGSFDFTAALPEGYALAEGAAPLRITVILGGAQLYDTVTGTHGDNLTWTFDTATGVLTVTGTGEMKDMGSASQYPWYKYRDDLKTVIIGEGITTIASYAFAASFDDTQLSSVSLPSTLKVIGYRAFDDCSELRSVSLPEGLETVEGYAFDRCFSLQSIAIGGSLKDIHDYAFCGIGLETLTVSDLNPWFTARDGVLYDKSVTELIAYPMYRNDTSFTVPASVTKIRAGAFSRAVVLSQVTFTGAAPSFGTGCFSSAELEVRFDSAKSGWSTAAYRNYGGQLTWTDINKPNVIGGAVNDSIRWTLDLSTGAFTATGSGDMESYDHLEGEYSPWYDYRTQITSVTVGSGITSVGGSNFSGCTALTSVSLPATVTRIGRSGFSGCSALASVSLPAGLTNIGIAAFSGCSKITSVTIPGKVRNIGDNAFSSTGLVSVTIPDSVYEVGHKAFAFCKGLTDITFGSGLSTLGGSVFQQCSALGTITFTGAMPSASDNDICVQTSGVTAIYPANAGWTESGMRDISTSVTWKSDCDHTSGTACADNGDGLTHKKTCANCGTVLAEQEDHDFSGGLCACGIGKCGDQVFWRIEDGALTIYGTGPMYDYRNRYDDFDDEPEYAWTNSPPWLGLTVSSVTVEDGVTNIGNYAFFRMDMGSVTMAGSVTKVGDYAFFGTGASVTASPNITAVGECGLAGTHVDRIAKAVTVGKGAFQGTDFTDGRVAVFGWVQEWAFYNSGVTTLILGENVQYIRSYALGGCQKLTEIYYCGDRPDRNNDSFFPFVTGVTITHYRTPDATGFSSSAQIWEDADHATVKGTPVAPTCTEAGYTPYTCPYCSIVVKGDEVPKSTHSYTYTADDTADTVTVGCGSCELEGVFALKAPASLLYTGAPVEATVTGSVEGLAAPTVTYTGPTTDGKPVEKGQYTATMTLGGKSVSVTFTVLAPVASVTASGVTTDYLTLDEALIAANGAPGSILKLLSAQAARETLTITGTDVTLDLNGFPLKNNSDDAILVSSGAKLTVTDSGTNGSIYGYVSIGTFYGGAIVNEGTLVLEGGSLSADGTNTPCAVINRGSFAMTGGTLNGKTSFAQGSGTALFDGGTVAAKMAVDGGTVEFRSGDFTDISSGGYICGADVKITGGSFNSLPLTSPGATVEITGGTFYAQFDVGSSTTVLYGGIFTRGIRRSSASIFGLLAEGYAFAGKNGGLMSPSYLTGTTEYLEVTVGRPNASVDFEAETLTGLRPGEVYTVNGQEVTAGSDGTIPIDPDWIGTDLTISFSGQSAAQTLQIPGRPGAPTGVEAVGETAYGKADGKLTGVTSAMEYRPEGGDWTAITGSEVTDLAPGTYEVRLGATDTAFAGTAASFTVTAAPLTAGDLTVILPSDPVYDGTPKLPTVTAPEGIDPARVRVRIHDEEDNIISSPVDAGTYRVFVDVAAEGDGDDLEGLTRGDWTYTILPARLEVALEPISRQLFTGGECRPDMSFLWDIPVADVTVKEGTDYTVALGQNDRPGMATVTVVPVEDSNFTFEPVTASFEICRGVPMEGYDSVYLSGSLRPVEEGILWLEEGESGLITAYTHHNAGAEDPHLIYPTGMTVWSLDMDEEGLHRLTRESGLDDLLLYSGTSIRITGNQGIRFITSIPTSRRSALMGSGLDGYRLLEYGTLMGWYEPGKELLYGVSAKSVAYDRAAGVDAVFQSNGETVQFTGMLTDLELEQSDRDLMTRPYMVLETDDGAGGTVQLVLYGGSITRSIGYVAFQNKDIFQPGTDSYEFIWSILEYAYPDLYEQEYQDK